VASLTTWFCPINDNPNEVNMAKTIRNCKKHGDLTKHQVTQMVYNYRGVKKPYFRCNACRLEGREREKLTRYWERDNYKAKRKSYRDSPENKERLRAAAIIHNKRGNPKRYGITLEIYNKMLMKQDNVCAICKKSETRKHHITNKTRELSIDHDHKTGKVRGLLCCLCNMIIGNIDESIDTLKNMIKYLKKYK